MSQTLDGFETVLSAFSRYRKEAIEITRFEGAIIFLCEGEVKVSQNNVNSYELYVGRVEAETNILKSRLPS